MSYQIQVRRDTLANWTEINPVLASGEVALETDTKKERIGDGVTVFLSLPIRGEINITELALLYDRPQTLSDAAIQQAWENIGLNSYATLAAANTGEALHNVLFYNTTLNKTQMTTSDS